MNRSKPDRSLLLHKTLEKFAQRKIGKHLPILSLTDAIYGWDNELWGAEENYLTAIIAEAERAKGSIVECGSGLSTLLLASIAKQTGAALYSFEHDPAWLQRVSTALGSVGLSSNVYHSPLHDYGEFDWYSLPASLPDNISLVVCDGPPASTRGGRYGALPLLSPHFAQRCTLVLDDAGRTSEIEILARWEEEFHAVSERWDSGRGYARVSVESPLPMQA